MNLVKQSIQVRATLLRAAAIVREDGLLALWFRILGELCYRRVLLLESPLPAQTSPPDGRCRWLLSGEAARLAAFHPDIPLEEVQRRLAHGQRCWILTSEGRIAHALWVAGRAWIEYLQQEFPLQPGDAYIYNTYTPAPFRGRGFAASALRSVQHALHHEGFTRAVLCLQPDRSIAYPPTFRAGFQPFGYFGWFRFGPWLWTFRRATRRFPFYAPSPIAGSGAIS